MTISQGRVPPSIEVQQYQLRGMHLEISNHLLAEGVTPFILTNRGIGQGENGLEREEEVAKRLCIPQIVGGRSLRQNYNSLRLLAVDPNRHTDLSDADAIAIGDYDKNGALITNSGIDNRHASIIEGEAKKLRKAKADGSLPRLSHDLLFIIGANPKRI